MTLGTVVRGARGSAAGSRPAWAVPTIIGIGILAALAIAGHRLVPDIKGFGSLVDTAAPWIGIVIPVLAVAAALTRSKIAAASVLVPVVAWAIAFGTAWLPSGGGTPDIRVASQNMAADNPNPTATIRAVEASGADLIGLEEVTSASAPAIASALSGTYRYHVTESTVQLWSRYRISDFTGVDLGLSWTRALRVEVAAPKGAIAVYVVHLASARAGQTATRDSTMDALVDRVRTDHAPHVIVIGDLNTASTDRVLAPLTALLHDTQASAGRGLGFTWPAGFPLTRPDHILFRGLTATQSGVIHTAGTDHRAITAGLRF